MKTHSLDVFDPQTAALEYWAGSDAPGLSAHEHGDDLHPGTPPRAAWIEIDLRKLERNFQIINEAKPSGLRLLSVVKDEAYGHGALQVAHTALRSGAGFLGLSTVEEAMTLRDRGVRARILLLGDRHESEFPWCVAHDLTCCLSEPHSVRVLGRLAAQAGECVAVHMKINTGMNRYGIRWDEAASLAETISATKSLMLEGVLSHFAQSDESDKTFARVQLARFNQACREIAARGISFKLRHLCNSGGFLDLPEAHFDMGRLTGIEPVMTVKARLVALQKLHTGDTVGYGMRYTAPSARRIAVLPIGYGDGFPRVRNQGFALVHGQRAPIIGGVAMDAFAVDITEIPAAQLGDEAVLMGRQGGEEISVHEIAKLKNSVSYDVLTGWRRRLPRIYLDQGTSL
jgi:alanine racemase